MAKHEEGQIDKVSAIIYAARHHPEVEYVNVKILNKKYIVKNYNKDYGL